ncbi:hypothetical protein FACS1894159_11410 [Bacteroidia bacterium]|nr:hypothetical protein FACS1894159_11410 [Bacteroidia bacterium]
MLAFSLLLAFAFTASADPNKQEKLLDELDRTVAYKHIYSQLRQRRIDDLCAILDQAVSPVDRTAIVRNISHEYTSFLNDSALHYVILMKDYALATGIPSKIDEAELEKVEMLRLMGQFKESSEILARLADRKLQGKIYGNFLVAQLSMYSTLSEYAADPATANYYAVQARCYRDSVITNPFVSEFFRLRATAEEYLADGNVERAMKMLFESYEKTEIDDGYYAGVTYSIANMYGQLGDRSNQRLFYTLSATSDLRRGNRSYISLRRLAAMLYEDGDLNRAHKYMKCAMDDAILSSARIRALEASKMFMLIEDSFQAKERQRYRTLAFSLCLTGVFTTLSLAGLSIIIRQNRRLEVVRRSLSDANIIKEEYIGHFMEQYSNYMAEIASYKHKTRKIAMSGGVDALLNFIETSLNDKSNYREFYEKFDATVLNIYPNFVEEFNALLRPEERVASRKGEGLTSELRIFALIRLGITDIHKIAHFLHYSVMTIYSYRSRIKSKARRDIGDLEVEVKKIGLH